MATGVINRTFLDSNLENKMFQILCYNSAVSGDWTVNEAYSWSASTSAPGWGFIIPDGYTPVCIMRFSTGNNNIAFCQVNALATGSTTATTVRCVKTFSTSDDITARIWILYAKSEYVS